MRNTLLVLACLASSASAETQPAVVGHEVIVIHDRVVTPAKSTRNPYLLPPYSDDAITSNTWTRAWLELEVSHTGVVTRVRFVKRPGLGLDGIAVATAFATRFEPARDRAGTPVPSYVVWGLEWPAYQWMRERMGTVTRLPHFGELGDAPAPRCFGSGPLNLGHMVYRDVYRDCSQPDLANRTSWGAWINPAPRR